MVEPGDSYEDDIGPVIAMAVASLWVMARRPGCMPFVLHESEWRARVERTQLRNSEALEESDGH